jgi:hypothetical protein
MVFSGIVLNTIDQWMSLILSKIVEIFKLFGLMLVVMVLSGHFGGAYQK